MHRVGRTGRADAEGWAFSLASLDEMGRVGRIECRECVAGLAVGGILAVLTVSLIAMNTKPETQAGSRWTLIKEGLGYVWHNKIVFGATVVLVSHRPALVLCLGQAGGRAALSLEAA